MWLQEFYGHYPLPSPLPSGVTWSVETGGFQLDEALQFQLKWEQIFRQQWNTLSPYEQQRIIPIQGPYTENTVTRFVERLKQLKKNRTVWDIIAMNLSSEQENLEFPVWLLQMLPFLKTSNCLPLMVEIDPDTFEMGAHIDDPNAAKEERTRHSVRLTRRFHIGKFPVSQQLWEEVMLNNPSFVRGANNRSNFPK